MRLVVRSWLAADRQFVDSQRTSRGVRGCFRFVLCCISFFCLLLLVTFSFSLFRPAGCSSPCFLLLMGSHFLPLAEAHWGPPPVMMW